MTRRQLLTTAALGGAATMLARRGLAQGRAEIGKLAIGFGLDPVFAPHIIAMDKGWLKDAGFSEISTPSFTSGATAGEALLSGDIQLWTPGNLPPISMAESGQPILVLGTNCIAAAADNLVARQDANVRAPEDLYRIKIGLLDGSTANVTLALLARHYGLDQKRLQVVNMPPPEQFASLKSNAIQAMLCWEPWSHDALALDNTMLVHSGVASGFEKNRGERVRISATRSLFVTSEDFVRRNPNATRLLMAVLVRAQRYVSDPANRVQVLDRVAAVTKQDRALVEAIWTEYSFDPSFDQGYVDDMRAMADWLVASGRAKAARDPLDYTYSDPAAAAGATVTVPGRWKP
jgi:ABC-type nitrate/sulfonate/bicarbonate transport system substrate-binding protein